MRWSWRQRATVWLYGKDTIFHHGAIYYGIGGNVLEVRVYIADYEGESLPFPEGATIDECKSLVEVTLRLVHPEWFNGMEAA